MPPLSAYALRPAAARKRLECGLRLCKEFPLTAPLYTPSPRMSSGFSLRLLAEVIVALWQQANMHWDNYLIDDYRSRKTWVMPFRTAIMSMVYCFRSVESR